MPKSEYYFPLLYRRLLVSTTGWKDEEFGAYLRLLIHQFDNNNRISPDIEELKRIVPSIKKNWPLISKKFKADETGMLYNQVMSDVYNNIKKLQQRNIENGKQGGRPKNKEPKKNHSVINGFKDGNPNERHTITITKDKDKKENTVAESASETASPQQQTDSLLFTMFKNCSNWKTELILQQVGMFKNKYPDLPLNKSGPVVNKWVANLLRRK